MRLGVFTVIPARITTLGKSGAEKEITNGIKVDDLVMIQPSNINR